jgi:hypothetical protein
VKIQIIKLIEAENRIVVSIVEEGGKSFSAAMI